MTRTMLYKSLSKMKQEDDNELPEPSLKLPRHVPTWFSECSRYATWPMWVTVCVKRLRQEVLTLKEYFDYLDTLRYV